MTCSCVKFGFSIGIFLNTAHLICRSTDISKCFRGSLRLRDNESRLYLNITRITINNNAPHLKSPRTKTKEPPWDGQQ